MPPTASPALSQKSEETPQAPAAGAGEKPGSRDAALLQAPWYKDAIIYQVHLKSFFDSDGDGIGDFQGLTQKLDYIADLGVTAVWVLPFYPSPLRDDGYDIADYYGINPAYGTLEDFDHFLAEAHRRGLKVITELVLNHTSDQHPWFKRARRAPKGSPERDFYVWSDDKDKYAEARIIFKDFEPSNWTWDPVAGAFYWHRFFHHQPDLNFDNPAMREELFRVLDFWLDKGVDGLRLDAVPYLFEREGTSCENLPETHDFLREVSAHIQAKYQGRMLLAEANQWPEDAVAYFGNGDECQMAFHFPLMPRMFMAIQVEDRFPILDILEQTPAIPPNCQWAMFLRNHDELTLEMVTDEERDYMYRVYAKDKKARINLGIRRRLAPLMDNDRRKVELMNILLLSMPGAPVVYYGDEIGMGDNFYLGDRDGVRTPMQWSSDRNAGFSRAHSQSLYLPVVADPEHHFQTVNVENQEGNMSSLLWWMRRHIAMRKRFRAFGQGSLTFVPSENPKVLAFERQWDSDTVLVVVNLSKYPQAAKLQLSHRAGMVPREVFGRTDFPGITGEPYPVTLGAYDHYWFELTSREAQKGMQDFGDPEELGEAQKLPDLWEYGNLFETRALARYLPSCRWFGGKMRPIREAAVADWMELPGAGHLLVLDVHYVEGPDESYFLPVQFTPMAGSAAEGGPSAAGPGGAGSGGGEPGGAGVESLPEGAFARVKLGGRPGYLRDGLLDPAFRQALFETLAQGRPVRGVRGSLRATPSSWFRQALETNPAPPASRLLKAEQSNSAAIYGQDYFLKLLRRVEEGMNPDAEILRYLNDEAAFPHSPRLAGFLEYHRKGKQPSTLALLQNLVPSEGDAWPYALTALDQVWDRVLQTRGAMAPPGLSEAIRPHRFADLPPSLRELLGGAFAESIRLLGVRTAEMHLALGRPTENPDFAPEPFTFMYQRSLYQSVRNLLRQNLLLLQKSADRLSEEDRSLAQIVLGSEETLLESLRRILPRRIRAQRTRVHGDYHLGQVLYTGKDFVLLDFEGEPARSLSEKRLKKSPLRDVAGMIRSLHYAAHSSFRQRVQARAEDGPALLPFVEPVFRALSGIYLEAYLGASAEAPYLPKDEAERDLLLETLLLEKAIYELGYELNNRPGWAGIPLVGIRVAGGLREEGSGSPKPETAG